MKNKERRGKLKEWLQEKGKNALGETLNLIGESTNIPIASKLMEGIGDALMDDPDLTDEEKKEAAELIQAEIQMFKTEQEEVTKRWQADAQGDNWLAKTARPITLHFTSVLIASFFIAGYLERTLPSEYTSLLIVIVPVVYGGYFALREFGKHSKRKNK